jgi:hypothetical protein
MRSKDQYMPGRLQKDFECLEFASPVFTVPA